ncbi:hypothetical protein HII36_52745 [Nonomuraea sp. NN258]|uniref:hypothetical protein n=1 Tax=Nonomuraea antri TaxID=2730852 RepID=UPI0015698ED3|nr:hypothetical protein [Nonomuraea antri]NRQ40432.1 hypothetical protein [Nonomuraea antri]
MVTGQHEGVTKISVLDFEHTAQALRALLGLRLPESGKARLASPDLSEAAPSICRADGALLYGEGEDKLGVITETQRGEDHDKYWSWLEYIANFRSREKCPVCLVVICPTLRVARWAQRPIETGHPGLTLTPMVIGPHNTPLITDVAEAESNIGLAVISAITRSGDPRYGEVLATLSTALNIINSELASRYVRYITVSLTGEPQKEWGRLMAMQTFEYQGEYAESLLARGREEGEARGVVRGEAKSVLKILEGRDIPVPDQVRDRVLSCQDETTLDGWLLRAFSVDSAEDLFRQ